MTPEQSLEPAINLPTTNNIKNILKLITGIIITLIAVPTANAIYCDPQNPSTNTYKSIYCDIGWSGRENRDKEIYKIVTEQLGYQKLGYKFIQTVLESSSCKDIVNYINEDGIDPADIPADLQNLQIRCNENNPTDFINALDEIKRKVKNSYNKTKVIEQTKKKLEYEFKASEKFWDGQVLETERASFDLIVDLNLIELVMFGSQAEWINDVYSFPVEEEGEDDDDDGSGGAGDTGAKNDTPEDDKSENDFDDSVTGEEITTPGTKPDCVPADDPNADLGNNPGDIPNNNCGNGVLDVLLGEQCDDGNNISGDGCDQYCITEDNGAGITNNGDICIDPEAVTFQSPSNSSNSGYNNNSDSSNGSNDDDENVCPPGTFPSTEISITGPVKPETDNGVSQSENYPGPFIGGTLKKYPPSNRPNCPEGYSELGGSNIIDDEDEPICIPTELCASFDDMRSAVFGENWKEDEEKSKIAYSIESLFCVKITKHNRPETPYKPDEGCIDCHIRAIVDSLTKANDTNVTPLANTTSSFGISSRWGPNLSFNLTTAIKPKLKVTLPPKKTESEKINELENKTNSENKTPEPSSKSTLLIGENTQQDLDEIRKEKEKLIEIMENYKETSGSFSDQEIFTRVRPLLIQMLQSFQIMQANYDQLTRKGAVESLSSKNSCE